MHLLNKYLSSIYHVPGPVGDSGDLVESTTDKFPSFYSVDNIYCTPALYLALCWAGEHTTEGKTQSLLASLPLSFVHSFIRAQKSVCVNLVAEPAVLRRYFPLWQNLMQVSGLSV